MMLRALPIIVAVAACTGSQPTNVEPATGTGGAPVQPSSEPAPVPEPAPSASGAAEACRPTGCSGTVCSDQDMFTTCEFKPEYACYRSAICERGADGKCAWRDTPELKSCLAGQTKPGPSGKTCKSDADCSLMGEACMGQEGCTVEWTCKSAVHRMCTMDLAPHCGCDGKTFQSSSSCPSRPFKHRGACKP